MNHLIKIIFLQNDMKMSYLSQAAVGALQVSNKTVP